MIRFERLTPTVTPKSAFPFPCFRKETHTSFSIRRELKTYSIRIGVLMLASRMAWRWPMVLAVRFYNVTVFFKMAARAPRQVGHEGNVACYAAGCEGGQWGCWKGGGGEGEEEGKDG